MTKILPLCLFTVIISSSINQAIFVNLNYIRMPMEPTTFTTYILLQYLVLPAFILVLLNSYQRLESVYRIVVIILGLIILIIGERVAEQFGVIHYQKWSIWLSSILWLSKIYFILFFYHFIHSTMLEEKDNDYA